MRTTLSSLDILNYLCLFFCISVLLPIFSICKLNLSDETLKVEEVLESSFVFIIAICFSLLYDLLADHGTLASSDKEKFNDLLIFDRYILIFINLGYSFGFFIAKIHAFSSVPLILHSLDNFRLIICIYIALRVIIRSPSNILPRITSVLIFFTLSLNRIFHLYQISTIFEYVHQIIGTFLVIYYFVKYVYQIELWEELGSNPSKECIVIFYFVALILLEITQFFIELFFTHEGNYYMISNFILIVFTLITMKIPGRVSRLILEKSESKSEVKSSIVKYISHELKFPINIASLGLQLFKEKLENSNYPPDVKLKFTRLNYEATKKANLAIGILNDISTIDKLDSKLMELERSVTHFPNFILSVVNDFILPMRKKEIRLELLNFKNKEFVELSVFLDGPKIKEVISNLMSFSLNFIIPQSTFTISLSYPAKVESSSKFCFNMFQKSKVNDLISNFKYVRVEIRTNYLGLQKSEIDDIFLLKASHSISEIFLGVQVAKMLIDLHKGRIGASSIEESKTLILYFDLPLSAFNIEHGAKVKSSKTESSNRIVSIAPPILPVDILEATDLSNLFTDGGDIVEVKSYLGVSTKTGLDTIEELDIFY